MLTSSLNTNLVLLTSPQASFKFYQSEFHSTNIPSSFMTLALLKSAGQLLYRVTPPFGLPNVSS